jgi:hypothetical protein
MISTFITEILSCIPVEDAWTNWRGESNAICYDNSAFWWAHSVGLSKMYKRHSLTLQAINIATDLWVLGLPIPMLWGLQLKLKKKIYLVLMFSVGIVYVSPPTFQSTLTPLVSPSSASSGSLVC